MNKNKIEAKLKKPIIKLENLNSFLMLATLENQKKVVIKTSEHCNIEGKMLKTLGKHIRCAQVLYYDQQCLIMEYIPRGCSFSQEEFAQELVALHNVTSTSYGFEYDTTIGPYIQKNTPHSSWIEFFKECRVLFMAKECLDEGAIDKDLFQRIENITQEFHSLLKEPEQPSLLHGDLWGGNILCQKNQAVLIDPAIYFGHYEMELAFITLFHTLSDSFFVEYNRHKTVEKEFFLTRKDIYNIYPLLVHIRSFGGSYRYQLETTLKKFGF